MRTTADAIDRYKIWQDALARWGDTDHTRDLFFILTKAIGISLVERRG